MSAEHGGADGAQPGVPRGERPVGRAREQQVGGRPEAHAADGGGVAAQREPAAAAAHVPQPGGAVRGAGRQQRAAGVEGAAPGGLAVATQPPREKSHTRTVESPLVVASLDPSGWKLQPVSQSE